MSHQKQRKETNCLNCNAEVTGRYCSVCGQENIEPHETAWHLITHFFNDITHFDSKFFTTLKILFTQPGFLAEEYRIGRRTSYLNPVRLYVFSSFFFFLVIFATEFKNDGNDIIKVKDKSFNDKSVDEINKMDSVQFKNFTAFLNKGKPMTRQQFKEYADTTEIGALFSDKQYSSRTYYDSLRKSGKVKDGWMERKVKYKLIALNKKYKENSINPIKDIGNKFVHSFPQMLFVSLPLFAFFLQLIYKKHKKFTYVNHGIFTIYFYVFCFMMILLLMLSGYLKDKTNWGWIDFILFCLWIGIFVYEYKAMRKFYGQGRGKTLFKMFLLNTWLLFITIILFVVFSIFIFFKL